MPDFTAREPALGYLYQARYALALLLSGVEEQELMLESLDDIVLEQAGSPRELLQTKHHVNAEARLTDASPELWKTLRVWSTMIAEGKVQVPPTQLTLITTAEAPDASIPAKLRPGANRDHEAARKALLVVATTSQNAQLRPAFDAFIALREEPALDATLAHYLHEVEHAAEQITKLEQAIDEAVAQAAPEVRVVIEALQALRGVAQTTAATVVCELGSLARFENPRQLMGYSGLVLREHSSGARVQRGGITKTGNAHLRRVLVEAAWAYQHRPNVQGRVLKRQKSLALSEEARRIAWKAQQRLHKRFTALAARGKTRSQIVTALARELLGFLWAIAVHTETEFKLTKVA